MISTESNNMATLGIITTQSTHIIPGEGYSMEISIPLNNDLIPRLTGNEVFGFLFANNDLDGETLDTFDS